MTGQKSLPIDVIVAQIESIRLSRGLNFTEFSRLCGFDHRGVTWSRIVHGRHRPRLDTIRRIVDRMGLFIEVGERIQ